MKKGFTLIEVLVVLAILGVISAFLINAISKAGLKEQERNKFLLRKAYVSLTQNAANILSNRQNYPKGLLAQCRATNVDENRQINFCDEFVSTINTIGDLPENVCNSETIPGYQERTHLDDSFYTENYPRIISADRMVWWGLGGKSESCAAANDSHLENKLCDGSFGDITDPDACKIIIVDVNGTDLQRLNSGQTVDKSKNIFGLDIFRFKLCNNGRVELIGTDKLYSPYKSRQTKKEITTAEDLLRDANPTRVRNNRTK